MKNKIIRIFVIFVFFLQLFRGFYAPEPAQGFIPSGVMNEPLAVVISALITIFLTWGLLELLFWVISKIKK